MRRSLVVHSLRWFAAARAPLGFVFGYAGVSRGRGGGIGAVCRQRPSSVLSVAIRPCGSDRPFWTVRTSFRSACRDSTVVRRARTPTFGYFLGDLWALGRELERRSIEGTHRCFLPASRPKGLTMRSIEWKASALPDIEWPEELLKPKNQKRQYGLFIVTGDQVMFPGGLTFPISSTEPASNEFLERFSADSPYKMSPKHFLKWP